jgi:hypothetical protein
LVLSLNGEIWAIEIKRTLTPKLSKGFVIAVEDIQARHKYCVYAGSDFFPIGSGTFAISLKDIMLKLKAL